MNLIVTNVYASIDAPTKRGFSFIEIWMLGVQIPIIIGILEYGIILAGQKYNSQRKTSVINVKDHQGFLKTKKQMNEELDREYFSKSLDKWTFFGSLLFIILFNMVYWFVALSFE